MTEHEIREIEEEIRARKDDGEHNTKIAVVSILLGCFAGVLGALLAQWVINTFLKWTEKGDEKMKKFETAEKLLNEQLQLLAQKSKECRLEDLADITLAMVRVFESLCYHAWKPTMEL